MATEVSSKPTKLCTPKEYGKLSLYTGNNCTISVPSLLAVMQFNREHNAARVFSAILAIVRGLEGWVFSLW